MPRPRAEVKIMEISQLRKSYVISVHYTVR
jgi:hypothetical protein